MARRLKIGVIGCGSAGPAAAIFLCRAGHDVTVHERASEFRPVGAGFLLQPTGLDVLEELGALPAILAHGARVRHLVSFNHRARPILDLHYEELMPGLFGVGLHRAVLLHELVGIARNEGVELRLSSPIAAIKDKASRPRLVEDNGAEHGPFDLVIVSDGARSTFRASVTGHESAHPYPWGALWFMGADPEGAFADQLFQTVRGAHTMVGFLPTGTATDGNTPLVSLFWSVEVARIGEIRAAGLPAFKERIVSLVPAAERLLSQIVDLDQLTLAQYHDVRMPSWHHGSVVFVGDAAHATSPQLGQGVNLALQDARVLAQVIADEPDLDRALRSFERLRRIPVSYYQFTSRWLTPLFQSSSRLGALARDTLFPLLHNLGFARRQMIATMAGIKRGFLRRSIPLRKTRIAS